MSQSVTGFMWTKRRFVLKKICGYQILGFFWTRLKVPAKRIWINLVKLHILVARIYLPFTRKHRIRPPKPHVFETTLHSVSFFGFEGFAKSCRLSWLKPGLFYFIHSSIHFQPTPPLPLHPDSCGRGLKAKQTPRNVVVIQYPEESNQLYTTDNSFQFDWLDRVMLTPKRSENLFPDAISLL